MAIAAEICLIDENYIKKYTTINGSVDPNIIKACLYVAQDVWVTPIIGTDLMAKIKADYSAGTITGIYETILDNYLRRVVMWYTMVELAPNLAVKIDNGNFVERSAEDAAPAGDLVMKQMKADFRAKALSYQERLVEYLSANRSSIPELNSNQYPEQSPSLKALPGTAFAIQDGNTAMSRRVDDYHCNRIPNNWNL